MIVITISASDGNQLDITAKDIRAISVGAGTITVSLKNAQEKVTSAFVSAVRTIMPDKEKDR